jgi:hypothetical protein
MSSYGTIVGKSGVWDNGGWAKFNCVAWNGDCYFASRQESSGLTENRERFLGQTLKLDHLTKNFHCISILAAW